MDGERKRALEYAIGSVPHGSFIIERTDETGAGPMIKTFSGKTEGRGKIKIYRVMTGVCAALNSFIADRACLSHDNCEHGLAVSHCRIGRVGWEMKGGASVYLGEGDIAVQGMDFCAESEMTLPVGYYQGLTVMIALDEVSKAPPAILKEAGFRAERLYDKFCAAQKPRAILSNRETENIFSQLYDQPKRWFEPYLKLKVQELLLYLAKTDPGAEKEVTRYFSEQTELIREIHAQITGELEHRYTIEELSKKYLINTSSLKEVFKAVYGLPIATYMKEYRLETAQKLLLQSGENIADIAAKVGYKTQGKFTNAFKERFLMTPSEYRKEQFDNS